MDWRDLDTPAVVVDLDRALANIARAQALADAAGLRLRPHIKTHKLPLLAHAQMRAGAAGITCQKLGEAEVMADAGLDDILVTYNILGRAKLERLAALHARIRIAVVCDGAEVLAGYAAHFTDPAHPLPVLIECETGSDRCGVRSPEAALELARAIDAAPGLRFGGLMTYPARGGGGAVAAFVAQASGLLAQAGLPPPVVTSGGTPDMARMGAVAGVTEYRPGTYVYGDRMQVAWGAMAEADCALTVLATVVSRPAPDRAILDAGSKALAADMVPGLPGHGAILEYPGATLIRLNEEHGIVDLAGSDRRPRVGEVVRILPNHACVVSNLFDTVHLVQGGRVVASPAVAARGRLG